MRVAPSTDRWLSFALALSVAQGCSDPAPGGIPDVSLDAPGDVTGDAAPDITDATTLDAEP